MTRPRILVVDNDAGMVETLRQHLDSEGWDVATATSGSVARSMLAAQEFGVVLTDLIMDDVDGFALLRAAQASPSRPRVLLMTAFGSLETAIEAIREGAFDYLTKPFRMAELGIAVRRAREDGLLREENRRLRAHVDRLYGLDQLIGTSRAMRAVIEQIRAIAATDASVLLLGESGTGKELVARAVHWNSVRRDGPFIPVNCAAIPDALLESELFGHVKGAFTGADRSRRGLFAEANGGTLFLDEVGEMPLPLQAKLLRALQEKTIRPVGGSEEVSLDFRVVSATNGDLSGRVREGRFREDLYYRLAVIPIRLPSLRERPEDIPALAHHFLEHVKSTRAGGFADDAIARLREHRWPGNVRELQNAVERAAALARGPFIIADDLALDVEAPAAQTRPTLAELERRYIGQVLSETNGDKRRAAAVLGISVRTLQRLFRRARHRPTP